jgi:hypothetical protein
VELAAGLVTFHKLVDFSKVKLMLSFCLIKRYVMKAYGGNGSITPLFLTPAKDRDSWLGSRPGRFTPRGKSLRYTLYRRLGGPQRQSGHCRAEKVSCPCRELSPAILPVALLYTD